VTEKIRERVKNATINNILATYLVLDVLFSLAKANLFTIVGSSEIIHNADSFLLFLPVFFPGFSTEITTVEHLIAIWICVVTTRRISNQARYFPRLQDGLTFSGTVVVQWLLFIYFLILLGSPTPALLSLPYEAQWVVFFSLAMLPIFLVFIGPTFFEVIHYEIQDNESLDLKLQEVLTAIILFAAALAIIFAVGPLLEIFVLLGLLLYPFSKLLGWKVDIEQRLLHLLIRLDDGERGFALGMVIVTGLYLASSAANQLQIQLTFLYTFLSYPDQFSSYSPFFFALILTIAIGGLSIFGWTSFSSSEWENKVYHNPLLIAAVILVVEGVAIAHLSEFVGNSEFTLSLSNPVVFAISLSICIVLITESKHYGASERFVIVEKLATALLFVPVFLKSDPTSVFSLIALPAIVYYLTPLIRKLAQKTIVAIASIQLMLRKP
jgi:hypothetical protein